VWTPQTASPGMFFFSRGWGGLFFSPFGAGPPPQPTFFLKEFFTFLFFSKAKPYPLLTQRINYCPYSDSTGSPCFSCRPPPPPTNKTPYGYIHLWVPLFQNPFFSKKTPPGLWDLCSNLIVFPNQNPFLRFFTRLTGNFFFHPFFFGGVTNKKQSAVGKQKT